MKFQIWVKFGFGGQLLLCPASHTPPRLESLPLRPLRLLWTDMDGHIVTLLIYLTTITPVYNIIYIDIYIIYNI